MDIDLKTLDKELKIEKEEDIGNVTIEDICKSVVDVKFVFLYEELEKKNIEASVKMFNKLSRLNPNKEIITKSNETIITDNDTTIFNLNVINNETNIAHNNKFKNFWFKIWNAIKNLIINIKNWIINLYTRIKIKIESAKSLKRISKALNANNNHNTNVEIGEESVNFPSNDVSRFDKNIDELNFADGGYGYTFKKFNPTNYIKSLDKLENIASSIYKMVRLCESNYNQLNIPKSAIIEDKLIVEAMECINCFVPPKFWHGMPLMQSDIVLKNKDGKRMIIDKMKNLDLSFKKYEKDYLDYFFNIDLIKGEKIDFISCVGTKDNSKILAMSDVLIKTIEKSKIKLFSTDRYIKDADYILKRISNDDNLKIEVVDIIDVLLVEFKTLANIQSTMAMMTSKVFQKFCDLTMKYNLYKNGTTSSAVA